jgi:hypothetical protein
MVILLYIFAFIVHILLVLAPYYVAYLILEPHSFLGIVGVFLLGSIIVPLSIFLAGLCVATIAGIIGVSADVIKNSQSIESNYGEVLKINTVNEIKPKTKNKRNIVFFSLIAFVVIVIFVVSQNNKKYYEESSPEENLNYQEQNSSEDTNLYSESMSSGPESDSSNSFGSISPSNYINDDVQLMNQAVNTTVKTIGEVGISGMAKNVRDCYVDTNQVNKLYCVYLDNSARLFDIAITNAYKLSRNEYFYDARSRERANKYLYLPWNIIDADTHFQEMQNSLWEILVSTEKNRADSKPSPEQNVSTQTEVQVAENNYKNEINDKFKTISEDVDAEMNNVENASTETISDMKMDEATQ